MNPFLNAAGPRAVDQYLQMGQATSVQKLYDVEAKWLAIPTFNTIAADDHGNAYYADLGDTPAVSQAELNRCLPPGLPTLVFDAARVVTLDGSQTSCAPANFPGSAAGIASTKGNQNSPAAAKEIPANPLHRSDGLSFVPCATSRYIPSNNMAKPGM